MIIESKYMGLLGRWIQIELLSLCLLLRKSFPSSAKFDKHTFTFLFYLKPKNLLHISRGEHFIYCVHARVIQSQYIHRRTIWFEEWSFTQLCTYRLKNFQCLGCSRWLRNVSRNKKYNKISKEKFLSFHNVLHYINVGITL